MVDSTASSVWKKILQILDEQLQYGFLEQAKAVVDIRLEGSELKLTVATDEAYSFFSANINQSRLMIVSRGIAGIDKVSVTKTLAAPIS